MATSDANISIMKRFSQLDKQKSRFDLLNQGSVHVIISKVLWEYRISNKSQRDQIARDIVLTLKEVGFFDVPNVV